MARIGKTPAMTESGPKSAGQASSVANDAKSKPIKNPRDKIVDALMALAAERRFEEITLNDIAVRAGVTLADFRDLFPSKGAVIAGFSRRIDRIVLEGMSPDMADELPRERLFDVLMRRLDAMEPYRPALEAIGAWARRDPISAAALNRMSLNSMRFMLEAAGIENEGPAGSLKLQGLVLAWVRVLNTWFKDDDPGYSATMADLDRELSRGERIVGHAEDFGRVIAPLQAVASSLLGTARRFRQNRRARNKDETAVYERDD